MNRIIENKPQEAVGQAWNWLKIKLAEPDNLRGRLDYQSYLLAATCLAASLVLGFGDLSTKGSIELRQREDLLATLEQVLPARLHDNDLLTDVVRIVEAGNNGLGEVEVYVARKAGRVTGVAYKLSATGGYSGPIALVMGVDAEGAILGTRVVAHAETPGLGDRIERAKSGWILSFDGRSLDNTANERWRVKKDGGDFDQFAGATITPRAVVGGVREGLEFFKRHKSELVSSRTE